MNQVIAKAYSVIRTKYPFWYTAKQALDYARQEHKHPHYFTRRLSDDWETADVGVGYTLRAKVKYDDFGNTPWEHGDAFGEPECNRRMYSDDDPGNGMVRLASSRDGTWLYPFADALRKARKEFTGYGRAQNEANAIQAVKAECKRFAGWLNDDWTYVGVIVELLNADDEVIGEDSVWGIESDCEDYLLETANDLAREVISNSSIRFLQAATLQTE